MTASGVEGLEDFALHDLKSGTYTVRLFLMEFDEIQKDDRLQTVSLQGQTVLDGFDVFAESGGRMRGIVRQFDGIAVDESLTVTLSSAGRPSLISGIEVIRDN